MVRVRWEDLDSGTYEDMASVLISTLHPTAERIDGAGGDGGRDVQVRENDRLTVYECKSFTGRLSRERPNRRPQVERSLARVAGLEPAVWNLVVPIDHNPDELEWFDGLREQYPFRLNWLGLTWLDHQVAEHPAIARYFVFNGNDEAMQALREIREEQAALANGVPDAIARLGVLRARLDEVSPHYRLDIALEGDETRVSVFPKYLGAEKDAPISVTGSFVLPNTPAAVVMREQLRQVFDYGGEVQVPDEYLSGFQLVAPAGLGRSLDDGTLTIKSLPVTEGLPLPFTLSLYSEQGRHLASLAGNYQERVTGQRGARLRGADVTGGITIETMVDTDAQTVGHSFTFSIPSNLMPGVILPLLRFARHLHAPNVMRLFLPGEEEPQGEHQNDQQLPESDIVPEELVTLVEDLDFVQSRLRTFFPVPDDFSQQDARAIAETKALLQGERVRAGGDVLTARLQPGADLSGLLDQSEPFQLLQTGTSFTVQIAGQRLTVRPVAIHCPAVRFLDRDAVESAVAAGSHPDTVRFAIENGTAEMYYEDPAITRAAGQPVQPT